MVRQLHHVKIFYSIFSADQTLFSKNKNKLVRIPTISSTTQPKYSHMSQKNYS
jgi:hypothetical protein